MSIIPIEHAFLINNNNEVVDPTLAINTEISKDRYGSEYMGIKIPNNILLEIRANTKSTIYICRLCIIISKLLRVKI